MTSYIINIYLMAEFNGIINYNGKKTDFSIYFNENETGNNYVAEFYSCGERLPITMDGDVWQIDSTRFDVTIEEDNDEVLIAGREIPNIFHYVCPCFVRPTFFVGSNRKIV